MPPNAIDFSLTPSLPSWVKLYSQNRSSQFTSEPELSEFKLIIKVYHIDPRTREIN